MLKLSRLEDSLRVDYSSSKEVDGQWASISFARWKGETEIACQSLRFFTAVQT